MMDEMISTKGIPAPKICVFSTLVLAASCLVAPGAFAQFDAATVSGTVRDASGAGIPNSHLVLTNTETGIDRSLIADAQGRYEFVSVPVGAYTLTSDAPGFHRVGSPVFQLTVNAQQRVDLAMAIGAENTTVEVSAQPTLLETETSSRGQLIGEHEVENLPLNGRSYADLALLVPGVAKSVLENQTSTSREASFNVNGQRSAFNNFLLDGLDNNTYGTSNQGFANENIPPSPDAVGEFRVETDNYSAEYGRSSGAVINVTTRSGTNSFHGRAWEYNRNTDLNAIGPFNAVGGVKPTFIRNQFGGTFGGPIKHDRLFFFSDYEGTRQITKTYTTATLPTVAQRAGTFGTAKITNPLTGLTYGDGVNPTMIPTTAFSPLATLVFAALPAPNTTVTANAVTGLPGGANFISFPRSTIQDDKGDVRLDYSLSGRIQAFGRYSDHEGTILVPGAIPGAAGGNNNGNVYIVNRDIAAGVTYILTPKSVLDVRIGFGFNRGGKTPLGVGQSSLLTQAGITDGIPTDPMVVRPLNGQVVSGYTQLGSQTSNPQFQNPFVIDPKINFTHLLGRHTLKLGYEYQSVSTAIDDFNPAFGQDTYASAFSGNNLADFIFGLRNNYQLNNVRTVGLEQRFNFMYLQDDFRASSRLTLNMGLRYEIATPQYEANNHLANFNPATASLVQASSGSLFNRGQVNTQYSNLAPRFGFAYSATPETVLRGGYGITYTQFNREGGENLLAYNGPYIVNASIDQKPSQGVCVNDTQVQTSCFRPTQQGYAPSLVDPSQFSPLKAQSRYIPVNNPTGYVQSYFLGVQRQIGSSVVLDLAYVGSKGTHLMVLADYNQASIQPVTATCNGTAVTSGCLTLQARRPVTTFNTIEIATGVGFSNYNSLQFKAEKRFGHGIYFLNSFTYGRAYDDASGHLETNDGDNSRINFANPRGDYGPSSYDQPLNNTTSLIYDLPIFRNGDGLVHKLAGGWELTGISTQTSGLTTNLNYNVSGNYTVTGLYTYRPNVTGAIILPQAQRTRVTAGGNISYLNPATVQVPTGNNPFGNASRNILRAPHYSTLDLGVHKQFGLGSERYKLDLRCETFNLLNQSNFYAPDPNRSDAAFGQISSAFPGRQIQLAGKLFF